jgi:hypothetical protein
VLERLKHNMGTEFDRAGDVDEHIDMLRTRKQHGILARNRLQANGSVVELPLRIGNDDVIISGVSEYAHRPLYPPIGYRDHMHAWHAVLDLVGQALAHEAGTYDADPDGPILLFTGL